MICSDNSSVKPSSNKAMDGFEFPLYCDHMPADLLLMPFPDLKKTDTFSESE